MATRRFVRLFATVLTAATVSFSGPALAQTPKSLASVGSPAAPTRKLGADTPLKQPVATAEGSPVAVTGEPPSSAASSLLTQTYDVYRTNPDASTFFEVLKAFKQVVSQPGVMRMPAASLIKAYPVLGDLGAKALEAGSGKVWIFTKVPSAHDTVIQWADVRQIVTFVGRRHRIKKVTPIVTLHSQILNLPPDVALREARVLGGAEGAHLLVLAGDQQGSSLWVQAYRPVNGVWTPSTSQMDSIPSFLRQNVSGKLTFRGPDLILTVAKTVSGKTEGIINQNIPEAESSTYKFWLHLTENGYVLEQRLPDEDHFHVVRQFLDSLSANRTEQAKSLLTDGKLISIPRYIGIQSRAISNFRVSELASPPSGAARFRLLTGGKDDLIFDVGRFKDKGLLIKAIFIAPPDQWLQQISKMLPAYDKIAPAPAKPEETVDSAHPPSINGSKR